MGTKPHQQLGGVAGATPWLYLAIGVFTVVAVVAGALLLTAVLDRRKAQAE